jgi:hypothetical protein
MTTKKPKPDDEKQSTRFKRTAREVEADESGEMFEKAFRTAVPSKKQKPNKS